MAEESGVKTDGHGEGDRSIVDVEYARRFARSLVRDESSVEAYLEAVRQDAMRLVADRRVAVEGLATALFERLRLNADDVAAIIAPVTRIG